MTDVLAIAAASMADDMARLATISHNLANATTPGFKRDISYTRPFAAYLQAYGQPPQTLATSLPVTATVVDFKPGSLRYTGVPLDLALDGDGFFELQTDQGPLYTRQGKIEVDARGRMISAAGFPFAGDLILTSGAPRIDQQGRVFEADRLIGQLRVVTFDRPIALQKVGDALFSASNPGAGRQGDIRVRQGYLENSNVVPVAEMVGVIQTMRHFEANQKLIQSHDDILDRAIRTLGAF
ncbi:MAG: flagellar hook basal-body protein [Burkholderiales bacterium]|nr:flagellar hook basal-body protein [Burkholderiales bacterium]